MRGIVTGASRGLGLALTKALSERGWELVVDGRDADALRRAVSGLPGVLAVPGDVADPEHRARLLEAAGFELELLVNNASSLGPTPLPALRSYPLDEQVELPTGRLEEAPPVLRVGDVARDGEDAGQIGDRPTECVAVAPVDDELPAAIRQRTRQGEPEPAGGAGDDAEHVRPPPARRGGRQRGRS